VFSIHHTSALTSSEWEFVFSEDFEITKTFLNGKSVTKRLKGIEDMLYNYCKQHYDLDRESREQRYDRKHQEPCEY
jgi:hypothetical protein